MNTDELFDALSNSRRRMVVEIVHQQGETRESEAAALIAEAEDTTKKAVKVGLYQSHSEKLDEAGLIDCDERARVYAPTELTGPVAEYVREAERVVDTGHQAEASRVRSLVGSLAEGEPW
jgi:hypothetical protein